MRQALELALEALEKLWNIIDDIDTYGDMAKADEKLYRALVERRQRTRFEETGISTDGYELTGGAITAIKEALAQPEQEPVALQYPQKDIDWQQEQQIKAQVSIPPQRTWVGLTDEDDIDWEEGGNLKDLVKAIEAKLKEKNNV